MSRLTPSKEETGDLSNPGLLTRTGKAQRPLFRLSDLWKAPLHDLPIRDEILYQYLPLSPEMEVLEVGPGSGFTAFRVSRLVGNLTLVDVAPQTIAGLKNLFQGLAIKNVVCQCANLSVPDFRQIVGKRFDAAYAIDVLTYLPNPGQALKNLACSLKPGGTLLLGWPNYELERTRGMNYSPTTVELNAMIGEAGFSSWEVYTLHLTRYADFLFNILHERPRRLFRRLRKDLQKPMPQNFDQTWHYRNSSALDSYRFALHAVWTLHFAALRVGGDCFERTPLTGESADGNLLLLARR